MCLSGEALSVIGRMTTTDSLDYANVKNTLLQRFKFTAQGYQEKFRKARAEDGETGRQLAARISGYLEVYVEDVPGEAEVLGPISCTTSLRLQRSSPSKFRVLAF